MGSRARRSVAPRGALSDRAFDLVMGQAAVKMAHTSPHGL